MRGLFGDEQKLLAVDFTASLEPHVDREADASDAELEAPDSKTGTEPFHLWGFIGQPGVSRATRQDQHLFVNRRPVENRGLNFALIEGYHTALMKGRYPLCCLFLELDPATVDVNIHPAKREVKFHNERAVRQLTAQAVREALLRFNAPVESPSGAAVPLNPVPAVPPEEPVRLTVAPPATTEFPAFTPLTGTPLTAWPKTPAKPLAPPAPALPADSTP